MRRIVDPVIRVGGFALACLLSLASFPLVAADSEQTEVLVSAHEVAEHLGESVFAVLDVRPESQYSQGHLPDAVRLPRPSDLLLMGPAEIEALLGRLGLDGSETVVLCGEPGDEAEVGTALFVLESAGVAEVRVLDGGMPAWLEIGGTIDRKEALRLPVDFVSRRSWDTTIGADQVLSRVGSPTTAIVDVRAGEGWKLYEPTVEFAAGHVPTALPYDFSILWSSGASLNLHENARQELSQLGPRAGTGVDLDGLFILYGEGRGDLRFGLGYLTLRALGVDVRIYPPGWAAWTEEHRPVVKIIGPEELESLEEEHQRPPGKPFFPRLPIFDLREVRDWEVGHIPGAFPLTAEEFPRFFELVLREYWAAADPRRDPLVVYCYGPDCTRSLRGMAIAARAGWRNIYWFRAGVAGWFEAGYLLERLTAEQTPWSQETGG